MAPRSRRSTPTSSGCSPDNEAIRLVPPRRTICHRCAGYDARCGGRARRRRRGSRHLGRSIGGRFARGVCIRPSRLLPIFLIAVSVAHADPKREVPDYDGRGNIDADAGAGAWALWIPRIVLSPLYVANEYLLRRPLGAMVRRAERDRWADSASHAFRFGEGGKSRIGPTALFELGLLPRVGLSYSRD